MPWPFCAALGPRASLATEGARAILSYGFRDLGLREILSFTAVGNARSRRVMERLGMRFEGEFDHPQLPAESGLRRHVLYRSATLVDAQGLEPRGQRAGIDPQ